MQQGGKPIKPPDLRAAALRCLARREHSRLELTQKLRQKWAKWQKWAQGAQTPPRPNGFALDEEALEHLLKALEAQGYLSQARVVESTLHHQAARKGNAALVQSLRAKGIDPEHIAQALAALPQDELARAQAVWQKKWGQGKTNRPSTALLHSDTELGSEAQTKERQKQARFLLGRGFSAEVVQRVLKQASALAK